MTTELMQVYSIEVGDTLLLNGDIYSVVDSDYADDSDDHILTVVDEEGNRKKLRAPGNSEVRIVVTEYV